MDIEFMKNVSKGEKVGEEKKVPRTEPWGTPGMTGEEWESF